MNKKFSRLLSIISALIREPLLQFLLIGAAIFFVSEFTADWRENRQRIISVDDNLKNYLENLYSVQFGVYPDEETLDKLLENYIREEVMYREALRLGLAEQDEIIRRRLVQKMEFLLTDNGNVSSPVESAVKAYYERHAADYTLPARVSFRHLYFSDDTPGKPDARQRAGETLQKVRSGDEKQAGSEADHFPLNDRYTDLDKMQARQLFGQTELIQGLFEVPAGQWSGPFRSGYGWHLIFVEDRIEERLQTYAEVADSVVSAWRNEISARRFETAIQDMISHYEIRREAGSGGE